MKRFILILALLAGLIGSGCNRPHMPTAAITWEIKTTPARDPWEGVDPTGQVIRLWHAYTYARADALEAIIDEFNRANAWGIRVEAVYQDGHSTLLRQALDVLNSASAPALIASSAEDAALYQLYNGMLALDALVESPRWGFSPAEKEDLLQVAWMRGVPSGDSSPRLGVILGISTDVLYYNLEWLQELGYSAPPRTPQEFQEMACKAAQAPFRQMQDSRSTGYLANPQATSFASLVFAFGGEIYTASSQGYTLATPAAHQALEFFQGLFQSGCARLTVQRYGDEQAFARGRALFTSGTLASLPYYAEAVEQGKGFAWGIAPVPHTTTPARLNLYGSGFSLLKTTPAQELAAWLFVKHFTSPEVQARWAEANRALPVRLGALDTFQPALFQTPGYQDLLTLLPGGVAEPGLPGHSLVQTKLRETLAEIATGADISTALAHLEQAANAILAEQLARQLPTLTP